MNVDLKTWAETTSPRDVRAMNDQEQINLAERIFNWQRESETHALDNLNDLALFADACATQYMLAEVISVMPNKRISDDLRRQIVSTDCHSYTRIVL